jgi:hypothetical protein
MSIPPRLQHSCRPRRLCCNLGGIEMFQEKKINKFQMGVKRKHLLPQNPMQPVETWIALARTRNAEENETLNRSLFRKMIPHRQLQTRGQRCYPQSALPIRPH